MFWLIQFYIKHFPFPHRGLKYFLRVIHWFGLEKRLFEKQFSSGFRMWLGFYEHQQKQLLWYGDYEAPVTSAIQSHLRAGDVFLDIGANIGYYSLVASTCQPGVRVIALEPVKAIYDRLAAHFSHNHLSNAQASCLAAGSENRTISIHLSQQDNEGMSSLLPPENDSGITESVEMVSLDHWEVTRELDRLNLVKIDTEGNEWDVLKGMEGLLTRFKPVVMVEINPETQSGFGYSENDLKAWMKTRGYNSPVLIGGEKQNGQRDLLFQPGGSDRL